MLFVVGGIVVREDEVPAVEAVLAAVGDDVAGQPLALLGGMGEEVTPAATVDADDCGLRGIHPRSVPLCE